MSSQCRSLPPAMRISVTANEKVDAQIIYARGEKVPTADPIA
jgi:hypothetical protein